MAKGSYPSDRQDQYMVRFPEGMRDRIKEAAKASGRSMNAEIIARLEDSFDPELAQVAGDRSYYLGAIQTAVAMAFDEFKGELIRDVRDIVAKKRPE